MFDVVPRESEIENAEPESDDMRLRDHKGITEGRIDILMCKPGDLQIEDGFNIRDLTTSQARAELDELKASIKEAGVQTPLKVRFDGENIIVVEGHRRRMVVMELLSEFKESKGAEGRKIEAVPIYAEGEGTEPLDRDYGLRHSNSGVPLKPLEFANLIYRVIAQRGIGEKEAAKGFGISITVLRNHLKLREMPDDVKEQVRAGDVSATTAAKEVKRSRSDAAANIRKAKEAQKAKGKTKATPKALKAATQPKAEPEPERPQAPAPETPAAMPEPPPPGTEHLDLRHMGDMSPSLLPQQPQAPAMTAPPPRAEILHDVQQLVETLIELTKQAHLCVKHNQSDEHPGWWSSDLVEAIRKARDVVERLTGKPMEFAEIADAMSQDMETA